MATPEHNTVSLVIPNNTSPSEQSTSSDVEDTPRENHTEIHKQGQSSTPGIISPELTPLGKRKRGRPKKNPSEKPADDGVPKVKRPRGRPKGSKNKNPKAKPIPIGPKRPRGRPRKWPPVEKPPPHLRRGRGRPRKDSQQQTQVVIKAPSYDDQKSSSTTDHGDIH